MKKLLLFIFSIFLFLLTPTLSAQNMDIEQMGGEEAIKTLENIDMESYDFTNIENPEITPLGIAGTKFAQPSIFSIVKNSTNRLLGLLALFTIILGIPLGIILLVQGNKDKDYNGKVKIDAKKLEDIYKRDLSSKEFSTTELKSLKHHNIQKKRSVFWIVFLHIITGGIFSFLHFGLKHEDLPRLSQRDFRGAKAIGFMFIPFFNIYWRFVMWLQLITRLNLQMKLRNNHHHISKKLMLIVLVLAIVLSLISILGISGNLSRIMDIITLLNMFVLQSIVIAQLQKALNIMMDDK